ncbi:MAG: MYG1 family protein [Pelagimonas sp.]|uniref:MYG1 family protein n=1 Tax=Pelagimonas sp. TaxID=2073170 RepID=UPI003D6A271E
MKPNFLVTHSGGFHADELCSSVILTGLFPGAQIVRSRAQEWITPSDDRVIYDVGGTYNPDLHVFDHHQRNAPMRPTGQPFSSFGLIWSHFGKAYLTQRGVIEEHLEDVFTNLDQSFVLPIDLLDNGAIDPSTAGQLSALTLPNLLETLKPVFDTKTVDAEDIAFGEALKIARVLIEAQVEQQSARLRAEAIVTQAVSATGSSKVLELPRGMPFYSAVRKANAEHLLFVVHPRGQGDWTLGGIRLTDDGFDLRADLPREWAGLTNENLENACGVRGATFCHNGRFIAAAKSREAILQMAALAVEDAENRSQQLQG